MIVTMLLVVSVIVSMFLEIRARLAFSDMLCSDNACSFVKVAVVSIRRKPAVISPSK